MTRAPRQYILLVLLFAGAGLHEAGYIWYLIHALRDGALMAAQPFSVQIATRTIGNTDLRGDQILAIDGQPFNSYAQYLEKINAGHPGDRLRLTLSEPSGRAIERSIDLPSLKEQNYGSAAAIAVAICLNILIPIVAIALGFGAAAIRPRDPNAWVLLFLLLGFSEIARFGWYGPFPNLNFLWESLWNNTWPVWMLLFAIYFPSRLPLDRRHPWLKYTLILPLLAAEFLFSAVVFVWRHDINAAIPWRPLLIRLYSIVNIAGMLGISGFFACLGFKAGTEPSADGRRRLKILYAGAFISLTPIFLVVLYSVWKHRDIFAGVPGPVTVATLLFLAFFPLTIAYVIVVERAMDLRFVIRQSLRYGLAKVGLFIVRASLIVLAVYLFTSASKSGRMLSASVPLTAVGAGLLVVRRRTADHASQWVDRRFFREAYNSEKVLAELATEVGRYIEIKPLLEKVARRISDTMHVPAIVVLVRDGNAYVPRYSTRPGEPMNIAVDSRIAKNLRSRNEPLEIYFDKPPLWIRSLDAEELQTLDFMRTQLLLPLSGQDHLTGILSLGPKLSEAPYSESDIRLLQAVASQMGLALENVRLAASLAEEAALRERASRELEIAREVQERLFPQNYPTIPGLDCAGYCRPARGVGGDYYDFLQLADGTLGIAVGDVSGKGIAAALLMASLQASLRGQAMAGVHDLAELMKNVNKLVYEASTSNRYATFFYGEYNPATRRMCFVNAGHNPPFILRGDEVVRLEAGGPVVGLLPGAHYGQDEVQLASGDIFVSFTDGISEAMNERDEEWEEERFIPAAQACRTLDARHMIEAIFRGADAFTGKAKQYDDMTLLVMKLE